MDEDRPESEDTENSAFEEYHQIAETVGGVPTFRKSDNLYQGLFILGMTFTGAGIGNLVYHNLTAALLTGLTGMIVGLVLSGAFLMVLGWVRASKKR